MVGAAMAESVKLGIGLSVGLCYIPLALVNLRAAIVIWLPSVALIALSALDVAPKLAGIMIVLAWLGAAAIRQSEIRALLHEQARLLMAGAVLLLWVTLSMAWAPQAPIGDAAFLNWLVAAAILIVISTTLTVDRYLRFAAMALVAGVVVSVGVGLFGGGIQTANEVHEAGRLVGGSGDPNFLAAAIVPGIILVAGLATATRSLVQRIAWTAVAAFLVVGLVASASRGGFVAALVGVLAVLVLAKRQRAWLVAFILCVVGVMGTWLSIDGAASERLGSLESNGRTELWGVAWQMWQDHPVGGVGLGGFQENSATYARDLGSREFADFLTEQPKVVHNAYLELLAETGLPGLVLYLVVVGICVRSAWAAARLFERAGDAAMATLSRSVIAAIFSMLAAAFFISAQTDQFAWVLLALGPALLVAARREWHPDRAISPAPGRHRRPARVLTPRPAPVLARGLRGAVVIRPLSLRRR